MQILTQRRQFYAVAGQLVFAAMVLVEDMTRPGFEPWRRWVSHLSLGPWGWLNTIALVIGGISGLVAASAFEKRWVKAGIGCYGGALLLAAACPIDPGLGWPPGVPSGHTLTGAVHQLAGALVFGGLTLAAWASRRTRWTVFTGIWVPGCFVVCSVLVGLDRSGGWPGAPSGLFERLALGGGIAWLVTRLVQEALASDRSRKASASSATPWTSA